jgi:hypothetical protein
VGVLLGVGDDPDVGLAGFEGGTQRIGQGDERGWGVVFVRAEDVELRAAVVREGVEAFGDPMVHAGERFFWEVIGEKMLGPGEEGLGGRDWGLVVTRDSWLVVGEGVQRTKGWCCRGCAEVRGAKCLAEMKLGLGCEM